MARVFNQNRIVNAKLGAVDITTLGKTFAVQYGLDGMSVVDVTVQAPPTDIKEFLEGNTLRTQYAVASDVDNLVDYVFSAFPNLEEIYLFNTDGVTLSSNAFTGLNSLKVIYVPEDKLTTYRTNYSQFEKVHSGYDSFTTTSDYVGYRVIIDGTTYLVTNDNKDELGIVAGTTIAYDCAYSGIVQDYVLPIKWVEGESTTLTTQKVNEVIAMLSEGQKASITKVVIDSAFTLESAYEVAWAYNWGSVLPICNNNIWYGSTQFDFTSYTIKGSGTLTSYIVESSIANISSDKISVVTKVVVSSNFASYDDDCGTAIINNLPNCNYVEFSIAYISQLSPNSRLVKALFTNATRTNYTLKINLTNIPTTTIKYSSIPTCDKVILYNENTIIIKSDNAVYGSTNTLILDSPNLSFQGNYNFATSSNISKVYLMQTTKPTFTDHNFYSSSITKIYIRTSIIIDVLADSNYGKNSITVGFLDYTDTVPTFSGYTDTWYEDEDCTTPIATTDFVSGNRYYVKLQSI